MHTYIHTHTYIRTCTNTYIRTYIYIQYISTLLFHASKSYSSKNITCVKSVRIQNKQYKIIRVFSYTIYWNVAQYIEMLHKILKCCTIYWNVAQNIEMLHKILKCCSKYWNVAQYIEMLHKILKYCTKFINPPSIWKPPGTSEECKNMIGRSR
jgi:hypothetical protein